jgi:hypothetical protein
MQRGRGPDGELFQRFADAQLLGVVQVRPLITGHLPRSCLGHVRQLVLEGFDLLLQTLDVIGPSLDSGTLLLLDKLLDLELQAHEPVGSRNLVHGSLCTMEREAGAQTHRGSGNGSDLGSF